MRQEIMVKRLIATDSNAQLTLVKFKFKEV
jgi:hypothetical protein